MGYICLIPTCVLASTSLGLAAAGNRYWWLAVAAGAAILVGAALRERSDRLKNQDRIYQRHLGLPLERRKGRSTRAKSVGR